jgi:hypothetical protein
MLRGLVPVVQATARVRLVAPLPRLLVVALRGYPGSGIVGGGSMIGRLGSLRVLSQMIAAEQIVGRERNHVACYRQPVRIVVVARRVNSTVIVLRLRSTVGSVFQLPSRRLQ